MNLKIIKLNRETHTKYDVKNFYSGNNKKIDKHFKTNWNSNGINAFILLNDFGELIGGFSLSLETFSFGNDKFYPAVEIKHFAILKNFQNNGYGFEALEQILGFITENPIPINFIIITPDLKTANFYKKLNFNLISK